MTTVTGESSCIRTVAAENRTLRKGISSESQQGKWSRVLLQGNKDFVEFVVAFMEAKYAPEVLQALLTLGWDAAIDTDRPSMKKMMRSTAKHLWAFVNSSLPCIELSKQHHRDQHNARKDPSGTTLPVEKVFNFTVGNTEDLDYFDENGIESEGGTGSGTLKESTSAMEASQMRMTPPMVALRFRGSIAKSIP